MPGLKIVPWRSLSPDALNDIVTDVVTREGTDVHDTDSFSAQATIQTVIRQLQDNRLAIVFDDDAGSCTIISSDELKTLNRTAAD